MKSRISCAMEPAVGSARGGGDGGGLSGWRKRGCGRGRGCGRRAMIAMQEYDDAEKSRFSMWYDGILPLSGKPRWEKRVMGRGGSVDLEGGGIVDDDSSVLSMALCALCLGAGPYDFSLFHFPIHIRDGQPAGSGAGVGGSHSCR